MLYCCLFCIFCFCNLYCSENQRLRLIYCVSNFADEQFTTIIQSRAGRFDPRVFFNCLQAEKCCERRLFIWLQNGDITNECINKGNTKIGSDTRTEITVVEGVIS